MIKVMFVDKKNVVEKIIYFVGKIGESCQSDALLFLW